MGVIPGYLAVSTLLAGLTLATLFVMVWQHRKSGICVALGSCIIASALVIDASTGAAWMSDGGRWLLFSAVGGGLVVLGVVSSFFGRHRGGRKPSAPPDAAKPR